MVVGGGSGDTNTPVQGSSNVNICTYLHTG